MIKIDYNTFFENREEYNKYSARNIWIVRHPSANYCSLKFSLMTLADEPVVRDGISYAVPKHITRDTLDYYIKTNNPDISTLHVEIDDVADEIQKGISNKLENKYCINLDNFPITLNMHWFNVLVMEFYHDTYSNSVCYTTNKEAAIKYLKKVCSEDNKPVTYQTLFSLFKVTGVSDAEFGRFVNKRRK